MSDASTTQPLTSHGGSDEVRSEGAAAAPEARGHGRHRGPVSSRDGETAPSGRHRKPSRGQSEVAA